MLRLHYYSDHPALAAAEDEETVYSIDLIKEFEAVGRAWKAFLADWLLKGGRAGLFMSPTLRVFSLSLAFCCGLTTVYVYVEFNPFGGLSGRSTIAVPPVIRFCNY